MKRGRLRSALFLLLLTACARPAGDAVPVPPPVYFLGYQETAEAAWHSHAPQRRRGARGEVYEMSQLTAAHASLPPGSWVVVENLLNGRTAEVRLTKRGSVTLRPTLVVSEAVARALGAVEPGVIPVRLRIVTLPGSPAGGRSGRFSVQVASFRSEYRAAVLKDILASGWASARVQPAEVGGQTLYRVRVGTHSSRREARRLALHLAAAGYPVIVMEE